MTGCGNSASSENSGSQPQTDSGEVDLSDSMIEVPMYNKPAESFILTPVASGTTEYKNNKVTIDASNVSQGYVMILYSGSNPKIKVQIFKNKNLVYTYDLNARGTYEVFPLSEGNGTYTVNVYENISGTKYSKAFGRSISVKLENEFLPFLYPNQYVNFKADSAVVSKASELCAGAKSDLEVVEKTYDWVVKNFTYDKKKAATVKSGYLPNVDSILASKTGICFDYASVMCSMLRSQNVPAKLVVGYTGDLYHAWINVYIEGMGWVKNMIFFDGEQWQRMDPTFASSGKESEAIMKYIGDNKNYQEKYAY
ncbi:MAG: transglutaminase-like domain-containing protein [Clostridia bacterium]|nr:transglutaminase-like domain-containing protein [Clostridia bacterium]